jgi:hypothetical protein
LITADYDVVPDDPWDYRGALISAFRRRNIYPRNVANLSEDALLWRGPRINLPPLPRLSFARLRFKGDPAHATATRELRRQACALGRYLNDDAYLEEFGLVRNGDPRLGGDRVGLPCIESIRTARRAGPDGQIVFDQIAEITQLRYVAPTSDNPFGFAFHGGAAVILGPDGDVRYVVLKSVVGENRVERRRDFLRSQAGATFWEAVGDTYAQRGGMFAISHGQGAHMASPEEGAS